MTFIARSESLKITAPCLSTNAGCPLFSTTHVMAAFIASISAVSIVDPSGILALSSYSITGMWNAIAALSSLLLAASVYIAS